MMRRISLMRVSVAVVAALVFVLFPQVQSKAEVNPGEADCEFHLIPVWKLNRGDDPPFSVPNLEKESVPRDLFGLRIDSDDNLYVVDTITNKLIKINPEGEFIFEVGQLGDGPEDVQILGEPIFWPGFDVAQTDYSYGSKIVGYAADGSYVDSVYLESEGMINRMWDMGGVLVAVSSNLMRNDEGGFDIKVGLVLYDSSGKVSRQRQIVEKSLPPPKSGDNPNERDFELLPLVNCGPDGRIYVVPDPYQYQVECYDAKLEQLWVAERIVDPITVTDKDLEWKKSILPGKFEPAKIYHAIDKLVPRADGTVWVLRGGPRIMMSSESFAFETFGPNGEPGKQVRLSGFPGELGDFAVFDNRVIWKLNDDVESVDNEIPYIGVFSIVQ